MVVRAAEDAAFAAAEIAVVADKPVQAQRLALGPSQLLQLVFLRWRWALLLLCLSPRAR